jgi:F1F0 ATPase subunit 2
MTPSVALGWLLGFLAGLLGGSFFFGGLWWTIKRALASTRPELWFLGSLPLRAGLVLTCFHVGANGNGTRLLFCALGFVLARAMILQTVRLAERTRARENKEATDGSELRPTHPLAVRLP